MKPVISLIAAAVFGILSSTPASQAQATSSGQGIDEVEVVTVNAVVDKIDLEKRKVTVTFDTGKTKTYKVDKSAQNLPQLQVGDHVKLTATEELLVSVTSQGKARPPRASVKSAYLRWAQSRES